MSLNIFLISALKLSKDLSLFSLISKFILEFFSANLSKFFLGPFNGLMNFVLSKFFPKICELFFLSIVMLVIIVSGISFSA